MSISYHTQDTVFIYKGKIKTSEWIKHTIISEGKKTGEISVIFCSDNYLLEINKKYLEHDYLTDIITFDYSEEESVSGDLFISIDTVKENAELFNTSFEQELHRVIIHGVLHLIGYKDKDIDNQKTMRTKEDLYLKDMETV